MGLAELDQAAREPGDAMTTEATRAPVATRANGSDSGRNCVGAGSAVTRKTPRPPAVSPTARISRSEGRCRLSAARIGRATTMPDTITGWTTASVPIFSAAACSANESTPRVAPASHIG